MSSNLQPAADLSGGPVAIIDFTRWTDAQLAAAERLTGDKTIQAEIARRESIGTDDGSKARVAKMVQQNRK